MNSDDQDFKSVLSIPKEKKRTLTRFPKLSFLQKSNPDGFRRTSSSEYKEKSFKDGFMMALVISLLASLAYQLLLWKFAATTGNNQSDFSSELETLFGGNTTKHSLT